jgi:two-component system, sensor histidine kinase and response regulator
MFVHLLGATYPMPDLFFGLSTLFLVAGIFCLAVTVGIWQKIHKLEESELDNRTKVWPIFGIIALFYLATILVIFAKLALWAFALSSLTLLGTAISFIFFSKHWLSTMQILQARMVAVADANVRSARLLFELEEANETLAEMTTDLERAKEVADQAKEVADQANSVKSSFLANMSHELRTPLNGVIGMVGLLLSTPLNEQQEEFTRIANNSAERMINLVNDLLDFTKIEAGKLELEYIPFDMRDLSEEIVESYAASAHAKKIEIALDYPLSVTSHFKGDPKRIRQVLANLLSNAIKFTEIGEVVLAVEALSADGQGHCLRISVKDTGIGLTPEQCRKIFHSFVQVDSSTTRRYGGSGLGLSIVKSLIEAMGGYIKVESEKDNGATFSIKLTLQIDESASAIFVPRDPFLEKAPMLIVGARQTNRMILERYLNSWECETDVAASGSEGCSKIIKAEKANKPYQFVLVDRKLEDMDGKDLPHKVIDSIGGYETTFILISAIPDSKDVIGERFSACISKPFRPSKLFNVLTSLSRSNQSPPSKGALQPKGQTVTKTRSERLLVVEDNSSNRLLFGLLLKIRGFTQVDFVVNGKEAVEQLNSERYDLVFMDCQMPIMDGYKATKAIRESEGNTRHTPIVALTANAFAKDRETCLQAGMDEYISKPIRDRDLNKILALFLPEEKSK